MPPEPLPELSAVTVAEVHALPNQPIRADTLPRGRGSSSAKQGDNSIEKILA